MDESFDLDIALSKAVLNAINIRQVIHPFQSHAYLDDGHQKIGYGYRLSLGITQDIAKSLIKNRMYTVGTALMKRAFETNFASDSARFGVLIEVAERTGDRPVLEAAGIWSAIKAKDYWKLYEEFLVSTLPKAYGDSIDGKRHVAFLGRVLVEGDKALSFSSP